MADFAAKWICKRWPFQGTYESFASGIVGHSGIAVAFKTTLEVFTRVGHYNSLGRLTERSVGLVTDRPSDVYELLVTPVRSS